MNVLITGASSGLGKQFAIVCAQNQHNLILVARNEQKLIELKNDLESKYPIKVDYIIADLLNEQDISKIDSYCQTNNVNIDILINNAGFGGQGAFIDRNLEEDLTMINLNIISVVKLCHIFLKRFMNKNEGKILNVSSIAALCPGPLQATYFATKAFISSFTNALWEELKDTNISITTLMPGPLDTNFAQNAKLTNTKLFKKPLDPYKVALKGYRAMIKGKLNVKAGLSFWQNIGIKLIRFCPKKIVLKYVYRLQK